jgi:hypothetical protein
MDAMRTYLSGHEAWLDARVALAAACARFISKNQPTGPANTV